MKERNTQPPKYLYRYIGWRDSDHMREVITSILVRNEMKFSAPRAFNDPFDCATMFSHKSINKKEFIIFYSRLMKEFDTNNPADEKIKKVAEKTYSAFVKKN